MEVRTITLSKEEWSQKYDSDVWLFSRLQKGELPSSPKYIKKFHDALMKMKKELKDEKFWEVVVETPKAPLDADHDMNMCLHNSISIVAHVFGHAGNNIIEGKDENLHFIFEFREKNVGSE